MWYNKGTTSNRMLVTKGVKKMDKDYLESYLQELEKREEYQDLKSKRKREWLKTRLVIHIAKKWYRYTTKVGRLLYDLVQYLDLEDSLEELGFYIDEERKISRFSNLDND